MNIITMHELAWDKLEDLDVILKSFYNSQLCGFTGVVVDSKKR